MAWTRKASLSRFTVGSNIPPRHTAPAISTKDTMAHNTLGVTRQVQFRLSPETQAQLDAIARHHGLSNRSEVVRFLAKREAKIVAKKECPADDSHYRPGG